MIGSWFVVLATVPLAMGIAGGSIFMSRANTGRCPDSQPLRRLAMLKDRFSPKALYSSRTR